jgi:hypothetical protein
MTSSPFMNGLLIILSALGFGGIVAGITVRFVGKKLDKNEKRREERDKARIEEITLLYEGQKCIEHLGEAVADAQIREHGPDKNVDTAMGYLCGFKEKRDVFLRLQAAKGIHGTQ